MRPLQTGDPESVGDGRYRLAGRLGQGGMGVVYLGWSPSGRAVAVKVVRPELSADPGFRRRFGQEVAAARRVGGFHTAPVVDADPDGDPAWLVTAYVPGPSLQRVVTEYGPLPPDTLAVLGAGLAEALEAIHRAGVIHRDLKPANIIVADDGPRVIDFGIARAADDTALTQTGLQIGTPGFLAPEQLTGGTVTPAVDVFALGIVLCHASGALPFGDGPSASVLYRAVHEEPDLTGVPEGLRGVVADCLAKDPARRPAPHDLLDRLEVRLRDDGDWLPGAVRGVLGEHAARLTRPKAPAPGAAAAALATPTAPAASSDRAAPPADSAPPAGAAHLPTVTAAPATTGPAPAGDRAAPPPEPPTAGGPAAPQPPVTVGPVAGGPDGGGGRRGQRMAAVGVTLAALAAGIAALMALDPFGDRPGGPSADSGSPSAGSSARTPAPLPTIPLLIRLDTAAGWPDTCHSVIALRPTAEDRPTTLVQGGTCDSLPQWAPDRRSFAFTRTTGGGSGSGSGRTKASAVWTARADGTGLRRIADIAPGSRVSWAPDGERLAVLRVVDGVQQLAVVTVADGTWQQLSHSTGDVEDAAWSPKGGRIAVCTRRSGSWQVYLVDPDRPDGTWRRVTSAPVRALDPAWSPDGLLIAYNSGPGGRGDIHVIRADGTGDRAVADSAEHEMDPSWSPDGAWIAYVRGPVRSPRVWAVRADGTGARALTTGAPREGHPAWR